MMGPSKIFLEKGTFDIFPHVAGSVPNIIKTGAPPLSTWLPEWIFKPVDKVVDVALFVLIYKVLVNVPDIKGKYEVRAVFLAAIVS